MKKNTEQNINTPEDLLDHLKEIFVFSVPSITISDRQLWMNFGEQKIISYIEKLLSGELEGPEETKNKAVAKDLIDKLLDIE